MDDTIKHYRVYCLLFPNKKRYIGLTGQKPEYRWNNGEGYCYQTFVYNAIKKYGWNNIERIILKDELTKLEAQELEKYYIDFYKTTDKDYGYNLTLGGEGHLILNRKNILNLWNEGKTTKEISEIINSTSGTINKILRSFNITHEEICNRSLLTRKLLLTDVKEQVIRDYKNKIPLNKIAKKFNCSTFAVRTLIKQNCLPAQLEILQYDLKGNFINRYPSASAAAKALFKDNFKGKYNQIIACANGKANSAYNFIWIFSLEENIDKILSEKILKLSAKTRGRQIEQYTKEGVFVRKFNSINEAKEFVGLKSVSSICEALKNFNKTAGGYKWKYKDEKNKGFIRKIEQYDLDGNFVSEFSCAAEVAKLFNVKSCSHILECCRGERKTFHGYIWKFKD